MTEETEKNLKRIAVIESSNPAVKFLIERMRFRIIHKNQTSKTSEVLTIIESRICKNCKCMFPLYYIYLTFEEYAAGYFHQSNFLHTQKGFQFSLKDFDIIEGKNSFYEPYRCFCSNDCYRQLLEHREKNGLNTRGSEWENIRLQMLKRDGYRCQKCGSTNNLNVHHIKEFLDCKNRKEAHDPSNLVTLCYECHKALHMEKIVFPKNTMAEMQSGERVMHQLNHFLPSIESNSPT